MSIDEFQSTSPSAASCWRAVILFGANSASYKFALGKTLLELGAQGRTFVPLEELAGPYSNHLVEHLKTSPRQATSITSQFLEECGKYSKGEVTREQMLASTVRLGFNNVLDAFHIVNGGPTPKRFFEDQRKSDRKGITLTDELLELVGASHAGNLPVEAEARWRLVETAWDLKVSSKLLHVEHDLETGGLFVKKGGTRRVDVTSCRHALSGYQKGKCFYCFADISVESGAGDLADVDHFLPHTLTQVYPAANLNGVWNLVLACATCNRGADGKFARVPSLKLLERLRTRNSFLIDSHHPLRETLLKQTGQTDEQRKGFLQQIYQTAIGHLIHT